MPSTIDTTVMANNKAYVAVFFFIFKSFFCYFAAVPVGWFQCEILLLNVHVLKKNRPAPGGGVCSRCGWLFVAIAGEYFILSICRSQASIMLTSAIARNSI